MLDAGPWPRKLQSSENEYALEAVEEPRFAEQGVLHYKPRIGVVEAPFLGPAIPCTGMA